MEKLPKQETKDQKIRNEKIEKIKLRKMEKDQNSTFPRKAETKTLHFRPKSPSKAQNLDIFQLFQVKIYLF